ARAHELLQHLLELGVRAAAAGLRRRVLEGLDREVDLAVLLDGEDLGRHDVLLAQVIVDVFHVVAVDLGDVNEAQATVFELQERAVRGDTFNGAVDDGSHFDLCDLDPFPGRARTVSAPTRSVGARAPLCTGAKAHVNTGVGPGLARTGPPGDHPPTVHSG